MSRTAWIVVSLSLVFALSSWLLPHPWVGAQGDQAPPLEDCPAADEFCTALKACTTVHCLAEQVYGHLWFTDARLDSLQKYVYGNSTASNGAPNGSLSCQSNDLVDLIASVIGDTIQFNNLNTANEANYGKWFRMICQTAS